MNNGQRCQINFLEHLHFLILVPLVAALAYPVWALAFQCFMFAGRLLFSIGYTVWGPSGRLPGALIMDFGIMATFCLMIAAIVKMT